MLEAALREQMLRCRGVWIFEGVRGGELQDARRFGDRFQRMAQRAGVPEKSQPVHALRITFASNLLTAGVPIFKVSKWLGHSSIQIPAAVPNTYWSFSAYADGQNFYVVNDREIDSETLEIILVGPETLDAYAGEAPVIRSPRSRGFLFFRTLVSDESQLESLDRGRRATICAPI